jgi:hypothetical protein
VMSCQLALNRLPVLASRPSSSASSASSSSCLSSNFGERSRDVTKTMRYKPVSGLDSQSREMLDMCEQDLILT